MSRAIRRFTILSTVDGRHEVIDSDGRPVDKRETRRSANGVCFRLNAAAESGPKALADMLSAR